MVVKVMIKAAIGNRTRYNEGQMNYSEIWQP